LRLSDGAGVVAEQGVESIHDFLNGLICESHLTALEAVANGLL
jgi:hypothetical protein